VRPAPQSLPGRRPFPPRAPGPGAATRLWYLSSERMTLAVVTAHPSERVLEAPPIARRFVGQPLQNLVRWMGRQPDFRCELVGIDSAPIPGHEPAQTARLVSEDFPTGPSTPSGHCGSTARDLTRPDRNLTQAQLGVARPDLDLTRAPLPAPGAER